MTNYKQIPFLDLDWQRKRIAKRLKVSWKKIMSESSYILGPDVGAFEREFAEFTGSQYVVGVANGTDALELGIRALGLGLGDEIIVPANSFFASAIAVNRAGAHPVFVDCAPGTWLIDPSKVEDKITHSTRAIMAVHLYGQIADMRAIKEIAERHNLFVIEDAAQAQGASQRGGQAGSFGDVAATSFYPGKNLGAFGDAGAVMTASKEIYNSVIGLRNYGSLVKYTHESLGFNSRMDSLQAAVLREKLRFLESWNEIRRTQAEKYSEMLGGFAEITLPVVADGNLHVWHLYVVQVKNRNRVAHAMLKAGVQTGVHYPKPIHLQPAYFDGTAKPESFPIAEAASATCLSLPIYPGLTTRQQERVVGALLSAAVEKL